MSLRKAVDNLSQGADNISPRWEEAVKRQKKADSTARKQWGQLVQQKPLPKTGGQPGTAKRLGLLRSWIPRNVTIASNDQLAQSSIGSLPHRKQVAGSSVISPRWEEAVKKHKKADSTAIRQWGQLVQQKSLPKAWGQPDTAKRLGLQSSCIPGNVTIASNDQLAQSSVGSLPHRMQVAGSSVAGSSATPHLNYGWNLYDNYNLFLDDIIAGQLVPQKSLPKAWGRTDTAERLGLQSSCIPGNVTIASNDQLTQSSVGSLPHRMQVAGSSATPDLDYGNLYDNYNLFLDDIIAGRLVPQKSLPKAWGQPDTAKRLGLPSSCIPGNVTIASNDQLAQSSLGSLPHAKQVTGSSVAGSSATPDLDYGTLYDIYNLFLDDILAGRLVPQKSLPKARGQPDTAKRLGLPSSCIPENVTIASNDQLAQSSVGSLPHAKQVTGSSVAGSSATPDLDYGNLYDNYNLFMDDILAGRLVPQKSLPKAWGQPDTAKRLGLPSSCIPGNVTIASNDQLAQSRVGSLPHAKQVAGSSATPHLDYGWNLYDNFNLFLDDIIAPQEEDKASDDREEEKYGYSDYGDGDGDDDYGDDDDESDWLKPLKVFFERMGKLMVEDINDPERHWQCPACQGGPISFVWYYGIQSLVNHARAKVSNSVKLHRIFADLLEEKVQRRGTSVVLLGEACEQEIKDRDIVWPPLVVIMNTSLDDDLSNERVENQELLDYYEGYAAVSAKHSYGPMGHRGMSVLIFESSAMGYVEAERLHRHFQRQGTGRSAWESQDRVLYLGRKHLFYGFLARVDDLDMLNMDCQENSKLEFRIESYYKMVVEPIKLINDGNQQSTILAESLCSTVKNNQVLGEGINMLIEENKELDAINSKDQLRPREEECKKFEEPTNLTLNSEDLMVRQSGWELANSKEFLGQENKEFTTELFNLNLKLFNKRLKRMQVEVEYEAAKNELKEKYAALSSAAATATDD